LAQVKFSMLRPRLAQLLRSADRRGFASAPSHVSAETNVQKLAGHIKSQVVERDLRLTGFGPVVANVITKAVHVANLMVEEDRQAGKSLPYVFFRPAVKTAGVDQVGWDCDMLCHYGKVAAQSGPEQQVMYPDHS